MVRGTAARLTLTLRRPLIRTLRFVLEYAQNDGYDVGGEPE